MRLPLHHRSHRLWRVQDMTMLVGDPLLPFAVPSPVPSSSAKGSHQTTKAVFASALLRADESLLRFLRRALGFAVVAINTMITSRTVLVYLATGPRTASGKGVEAWRGGVCDADAVYCPAPLPPSAAPTPGSRPRFFCFRSRTRSAVDSRSTLCKCW